MASPALLRSAAGRSLRRSTIPSLRSARVFFSGVAGRTGPFKFPSSSPNWTEGGRFNSEMAWAELKDQVEALRRETQGLVQVTLEQEKRVQRNEQLQKKIACVLLPTTAAVWIFGPEKKGKSSAEEQASP